MVQATSVMINGLPEIYFTVCAGVETQSWGYFLDYFLGREKLEAERINEEIHTCLGVFEGR